jgi:Spy/CpxP family protein refolding chaperone
MQKLAHMFGLLAALGLAPALVACNTTEDASPAMSDPTSMGPGKHHPHPHQLPPTVQRERQPTPPQAP